MPKKNKCSKNVSYHHPYPFNRPHYHSHRHRRDNHHGHHFIIITIINTFIITIITVIISTITIPMPPSLPLLRHCRHHHGRRLHHFYYLPDHDHHHHHYPSIMTSIISTVNVTIITWLDPHILLPPGVSLSRLMTPLSLRFSRQGTPNCFLFPFVTMPQVPHTPVPSTSMTSTQTTHKYL